MNLFGVLIRVSERWQSALLNFALVVFECTFVCLVLLIPGTRTLVLAGPSLYSLTVSLPFL